MKFQLRNLILLTILASVSLVHAQAAENKVEILNDKEMAGVKGGFCLIEQCETGAPSGQCQPYSPTFEGLCHSGTCYFKAYNVPLIGQVDVCTIQGKVTCSGSEGYRSCIMGKLWDICVYSNVNVCGSIIQPFCTENIEEKTCTCNIMSTTIPCDWTNCLLESQ